jgi:hypothetical protein
MIDEIPVVLFNLEYYTFGVVVRFAKSKNFTYRKMTILYEFALLRVYEVW